MKFESKSDTLKLLDTFLMAVCFLSQVSQYDVFEFSVITHLSIKAAISLHQNRSEKILKIDED